jgi:hypothetical protein
LARSGLRTTPTFGRLSGGTCPLGARSPTGCELSRSGEARRVTIRLLVVDYRREVMKEGASFVRRDGDNARASGKLV